VTRFLFFPVRNLQNQTLLGSCFSWKVAATVLRKTLRQFGELLAHAPLAQSG
jgi:hypothetical protein